jgi:hypothetical protein
MSPVCPSFLYFISYPSFAANQRLHSSLGVAPQALDGYRCFIGPSTE